MVQYKLTYFGGRGYAEVSRLILHYSGVDFEDYRMGKFGDPNVFQEIWPKVKPTTPFGQVPILEFEGKTLGQSFAIARYLAKTYDLAGTDDFERAQLDSYADYVKDINNELRPYFFALMGLEKGDRDELYKTVFKPVLEKHMPILEERLKGSNSGFFGKNVSWVDFFVASFTETLENHGKDIIGGYKILLDHKNRVYALPELEKYLSTRPKTPF